MNLAHAFVTRRLPSARRRAHASELRPHALERPQPSGADTSRRLPVGEDHAGNVVFWDLDVAAHCIVVGPTGSGSSVVLPGVVAEAAARGWECQICDAFAVYRGVAASTGVRLASGVDKHVEAIQRVWCEMQRRYDALGVGGDRSVPLLLVLDEFFAHEVLARTVPTTTPGVDKRVVDLVSDIGRKGRAVSVHLAVNVRHATTLSSWYSAAIDDFTARFSLGRLDPVEDQLLWGAAAPEMSVAGRPGRGVACGSEGRPVPFQAYVPSLSATDPQPNPAEDVQLTGGGAQHRQARS